MNFAEHFERAFLFVSDFATHFAHSWSNISGTEILLSFVALLVIGSLLSVLMRRH
jgi:hypothetical protein